MPQCGPASVVLTLDTYFHVLPTMQEEFFAVLALFSAEYV
jgi:hypothetical protein